MSELEPEEKYSTEIDIHNEENYVDDEYKIDGESVPEVKVVAIDQTVTRKTERQLSNSKYELSMRAKYFGHTTNSYYFIGYKVFIGI